ncbi:MAG: WYL domain-containing protein [Bacteroidota bacterium]
MPVNKNAYKRYLIIHNFLKKSLKVPKSKARILEILDEEGFQVSPSMFEKDLEAMRNTFGLPIKYHREPDVGGYYYSDTDVSFDIPMSDDVVKTIYGALNQLALFQNTAAFRNAKDSLEKIMSRLEIDLKRPMSGKERIIFYEPQTKFSGSEWIAPIYDAIVERQRITFMFSLFDVHHNHTVEPYALKEIAGRWYVLGAEDEKEAVYGLDRISNLSTSDQYFAFDGQFRDNLHYKLRHSVGALDFTKRNHGVRIFYDNSVADEILTTKINETQEVIARDEHGVVIYADVNINEEFVRSAVLPYGDKAEVIWPPFVIDRVIKILQNILRKYDHHVEKRDKRNKPPDTVTSS